MSTKRIFDLIVAALALIVTSPLQIVIAGLVWRRLGWPVLFRQVRPGLHGERFTLLKFRTMTDERDEHGEMLPDSQRLPNFGRLLRSTSLDELPELWNVLRGDMSFVGPRPLLTEYLPWYSRRQARRHEVLPGLTGWAQVNGRNEPDWGTRLEMDVWYVENRSFGLDVRILIKTIDIVFRRVGITGHGHATAPRFDDWDGSCDRG